MVGEGKQRGGKQCLPGASHLPREEVERSDAGHAEQRGRQAQRPGAFAKNRKRGVRQNREDKVLVLVVVRSEQLAEWHARIPDIGQDLVIPEAGVELIQPQRERAGQQSQNARDHGTALRLRPALRGRPGPLPVRQAWRQDQRHPDQPQGHPEQRRSQQQLLAQRRARHRPEQADPGFALNEDPAQQEQDPGNHGNERHESDPD